MHLCTRIVKIRRDEEKAAELRRRLIYVKGKTEECAGVQEPAS